MRQFVGGVVVGAGAAALVVAFWPGPATAPAAPAAGTAPSGSESFVSSRVASSPAPMVAKSPGAPPLQPSVPIAVASPASTARLAIAAVPPAATASQATIALSAEHAKVLTPNGNQKRRPTLPELHEQILAQSKDANWSYPTEQSIRQSLQEANAANEFEIMSVECRQTMCEVLAFGNQPLAGEHWNQAFDKMSKQSWYSGFTGNSTSTSVQNDRYVIVTILENRKK